MPRQHKNMRPGCPAKSFNQLLLNRLPLSKTAPYLTKHSAFSRLKQTPGLGNLECEFVRGLYGKKIGDVFGVPRFGMGTALTALFGFASASRAGVISQIRERCQHQSKWLFVCGS
jgi:hypothetical protein